MKSWDPALSIVITRGSDPFGALLNMTGGYPISWCGKVWKSSEALYQAARYPNDEHLQEDIRTAATGWAAKQMAKQHYAESRSDWMKGVRLAAMVQVCQLKHDQHKEIAEMLKDSMPWEIVEGSKRDDFWGAKPQPDGSLLGHNMLGEIWMRIRSGKRLIHENILPGNTLDEFFC